MCMINRPDQYVPSQWRHNWRDGVSNHQPHHCLLNRLFRHRSKKTSKSRLTGLCARNSPVTDEYPAQMANYAENVSIWWRHHGYDYPIISLNVNVSITFIFLYMTPCFPSSLHKYIQQLTFHHCEIIYWQRMNINSNPPKYWILSVYFFPCHHPWKKTNNYLRYFSELFVGFAVK